MFVAATSPAGRGGLTGPAGPAGGAPCEKAQRGLPSGGGQVMTHHGALEMGSSLPRPLRQSSFS